MHPNDAARIANSIDPDQTAPPLGAVWSGSALFAQVWKLRIITVHEKSILNLHL